LGPCVQFVHASPLRGNGVYLKAVRAPRVLCQPPQKAIN
jgi:hypothetical protein